MTTPLLEVDAESKSRAETTASDIKITATKGNLFRGSRRNVAINVLVVLALIAALYLGRAFFVPLLIGILASYMLRPVVDWLKALYVPRPVAAALVLVVLVGSLSWIALSLRDEATIMIESLPEAALKLRQKLSAARAGSPTALQNMQQAANELQGAATDAGLKPGTRVVVAREPETTAWLRDYALAQSAMLISVAAQAPIVLLLTYFLLASGKHFRRKLVQFVGPSHQKETVNILEEITVQIQRYLLVTLVSNILIGVCTWLAFRALGMEQAGVWGFAAGVLHFMPYLGPALITLASGVAAFMQFGSPLNALAVAGASLLVAGAIGMVFMTWLQSHFAHMSAAVLFIALLFFGWMWGVWGLLLSAPLVTIAKVICDRVESLKPVGELLGR
ncbi:MAG: AI-2E family transporter [Sulfuricaulis sp.]|nr:AI-2E family transporter [Sulfuricaulis sp.]